MLTITLCLLFFVLLGSTTGCEVIRTADMAYNVFKLIRVAHQLGGTSDKANELEELQRLAEQGIAESQNKLGEIYDYGWGVPTDDGEAVKWYRLAAEQRHVPAQSNLGWMYKMGRGVKMENIRAHMWFDIAVSLGDKDNAPKFRDEVARYMTSAQIAKAQKLANECKRKNYKDC